MGPYPATTVRRLGTSGFLGFEVPTFCLFPGCADGPLRSVVRFTPLRGAAGGGALTLIGCARIGLRGGSAEVPGTGNE